MSVMFKIDMVVKSTGFECHIYGNEGAGEGRTFVGRGITPTQAFKQAMLIYYDDTWYRENNDSRLTDRTSDSLYAHIEQVEKERFEERGW